MKLAQSGMSYAMTSMPTANSSRQGWEYGFTMASAEGWQYENYIGKSKYTRHRESLSVGYIFAPKAI